MLMVSPPYYLKENIYDSMLFILVLCLLYCFNGKEKTIEKYVHFFRENSQNYHCSVDVFIHKKAIRKMKIQDLF